MDNLTHTLLAVTMSRAGLNRLTPYATGLLALGANAPDVDVVSRLGSTINYLEHHRGITHSLVASPVMAAAVAGTFWLLHRSRRAQQPFHFAPAFVMALAGALSHLLLDFSTQYGTRLLLPFSGRWLAWDIMPIVDIWVLVLLAACLVLPFLFHLVSEEIGAARTPVRPWAIFALAAMAFWFGLRDFSHRRAVAIVDSHIYRDREPLRVGAFPDLVNPFLWHGVVETGATMELVEVNLFEEFDPTRARTYWPPDPHPALDAARKTRAARVFQDFAAYPFTYVDRAEKGYEVVFRDLRFDYGVTGRRGFVARVALDENLRVLRESFHFQDSEPAR